MTSSSETAAKSGKVSDPRKMKNKIKDRTYWQATRIGRSSIGSSGVITGVKSTAIVPPSGTRMCSLV